MSDYVITDFGAVADATTDNAPAINKAIAAAHQAGGGRVVVPPSGDQSFLIGTIHFQANVELHLATGATSAGAS